MGQGVLVRAIVIHGPDFLAATPAAHEINLALRYALNAATETKNNLVGKFMGDGAGSIGGSGILVLLAQHLRRSDILRVIEPALHGQGVAGGSQIAESQHSCIRGRSTPRLKLHIGRTANRS